MDLQIYLIIITVFFISLGSLIFVNRQLRSGKTYEEALAEKRQLTEKLYGNKKKTTTKKTNTGKKVKIALLLYKFGHLRLKIFRGMKNKWRMLLICCVILFKNRTETERKQSNRKALSSHRPWKVMVNPIAVPRMT